MLPWQGRWAPTGSTVPAQALTQQPSPRRQPRQQHHGPQKQQQPPDGAETSERCLSRIFKKQREGMDTVSSIPHGTTKPLARFSGHCGPVPGALPTLCPQCHEGMTYGHGFCGRSGSGGPPCSPSL